MFVVLDSKKLKRLWYFNNSFTIQNWDDIFSTRSFDLEKGGASLIFVDCIVDDRNGFDDEIVLGNLGDKLGANNKLLMV